MECSPFLMNMRKLLFYLSLFLFPSLCSAQTTADIPKSEKVAVNTECKADSLRKGIQGKDIKEIDDEDIDVETVATYLDIFNRLFLTDNQPPFSAKLPYQPKAPSI